MKSYTVTQRTNEIGVRMVLGATSREISLSFAKRGLALTFAGLAIGLVLSAIAARLMTNLLHGFRPDYVPTATVAAFILLTVAALEPLLLRRAAPRTSIRSLPSGSSRRECDQTRLELFAAPRSVSS